MNKQICYEEQTGRKVLAPRDVSGDRMNYHTCNDDRTIKEKLGVTVISTVIKVSKSNGRYVWEECLTTEL
jgi:hypothetical protein